MLLYSDRAIFIHGFDYRLGSVQRDLEELKADKCLLGTVETLDRIGYHYNFSLGNDESLLSLARHPLSQVLQRAPEPRGLVFQHSFAESAVLTCDVNETNIALRTRYFAAEVMRELELDHFAVFLFICYRLLRLHLGLDYGSRSIPVPQTNVR